MKTYKWLTGCFTVLYETIIVDNVFICEIFTPTSLTVSRSFCTVSVDTI